MIQDFSKLQPEDRHVILVASDTKYRELTEAIDFKKLLPFLAISKSILPAPVSIGVTALLESPYISASLNSMGINRNKDFRKLFQRGEIPFPHLAPSEAKELFGFDHGHPQDGMAYLLDATQDNYYLVPAIANERLAQQKVAAFLDLTSALGAKRLELVSGDLLERKLKSNAKLPLKQAAAQVNISASFGSAGEVTRKLYAEFGKPERSPYIPDHVNRWLNTDPMFHSLARSRIDGSIEKCGVSLIIGSTMDVDSKGVAAIGRFKAEVGGKYHKVARTTWSFEIEFWPKARRGKSKS